jgi:hypothetical protein
LAAVNIVRAEVVDRQCGGPVRREKKPVRLNANPAHRKGKRAMRAFS